MSDKDFKSPEERRKALKKILTGTGAVTIAANAPDKWTKPVIDSVILPSHAQTSAPLIFGRMNLSLALNGPNDVLDTLVPSAHAGPQLQLWNLCITFTNTNLTTYDAALWDNGDAIWLVTGGTVGVQADFDCVDNSQTITLTNPSSTSVHYYITTTAEGPILEGDAIPMACNPPVSTCPD